MQFGRRPKRFFAVVNTTENFPTKVMQVIEKIKIYLRLMQEFIREGQDVSSSQI